ncbi:MAG: carboxypeptidase regulatory-like domain-containing protein, partial [Acidobacteriota bacterium]|nr:carboxypeptidase regulatory-like domain-containing protein [Acidobacteriota bacterium]
TGDSGLTQAKERLKLAAIFQFTYIGAPMVYYGDEAGMNSPSLGNSGAGLPEDDPYNRAPYPWADESGNPNVYGPADNNLLNFYTTLGNFRRNHPALRTGKFEALLMGDITPSATDNNTFAFARAENNDKVIVVMNNGSTANTATIPVGEYYPDGTILSDAIGNNQPPVAGKNSGNLMASYTVSGGTITVTLPARGGAVLTALAPTAASVSVSGKVLSAAGREISGATVTITDSRGESRTAITNAFGYYQFEGVQAGETYLLGVRHKRYQFLNQAINVNEDLTDVNITAQP